MFLPQLFFPSSKMVTILLIWKYVVCVLSRTVVSNSVTPWAAACQAPLSVGSPGKDTGVGCHSLLQGIFPTQGWNPTLQCSSTDRQIFYHCATWEALGNTL